MSNARRGRDLPVEQYEAMRLRPRNAARYQLFSQEEEDRMDLMDALFDQDEDIMSGELPRPTGAWERQRAYHDLEAWKEETRMQMQTRRDLANQAKALVRVVLLLKAEELQHRTRTLPPRESSPVKLSSSPPRRHSTS